MPLSMQKPTLRTTRGLTQLNLWLAAILGFSAFLPLGLTYLATLLLTLGVLCARHDWAARMGALKLLGWGGLLCLFLAWPFALALVGYWHDSTDTRLFHLVRVAWVVALGLVLTIDERHQAIKGFLLGAGCGAAVVVAHHLWGLPPWSIWHAFLEVRGNSSSQKMILMALAAGMTFWLGLNQRTGSRVQLTYLATALLFTAVVSLHGISRNAHLLLLVLPLTVIMYRWRDWRPLTVGVLAVALATVTIWHLSPQVESRFETAATELKSLITEENYNSSVGVRGRMWLEAWRGFTSEPWIGTGVGSWEPIWREAATEFPDLAGINNPHNDYALFAMETGLPGLLLLLAIPIGLCVRNWQARSTLGGMGLLAVMTVLVSTSVNAPWRDAGLGMAMLWLMAAMTDLRHRKHQNA